MWEWDSGLEVEKGNKKRKVRSEELFEVVEFEYTRVSEIEYERRVCAVVKALLEIDGVLATKDNLLGETKEAA